MSHNVCCVEFNGKKYRLPRYSVGEMVEFRGRKMLVVCVESLPSGEVIYNLAGSHKILTATVSEYQLLHSSDVSTDKGDSFCGFRVGDTVVDKHFDYCIISTVEGFDYKRGLVRIKSKDYKLSYLVSPTFLRFINPVTLVMSTERKILDEK